MTRRFSLDTIQFVGKKARSYPMKLIAKLAPATISDRTFTRNLVPGNTEELIKRIRTRERPVFFIDPKDKNGTIATLDKELPSVRDKTLSSAQQICQHTFDLLGSGKSNLNVKKGRTKNYRKIDWYRDFKRGVSWDPDVFYADTEIIKGNGSDIKVPWELSRFQHFPTLGKAYWLTGDEKYAQEFVNEINDWIESNPPQFGVNWAGTMDIAIRTVNWIWGFHFLKDSPQLSDEFLTGFLKSLLIHGRHIRNNLERNLSGVNTNHYLSNLVGLVYLGVMFPEFKEATKWREFGTKELTREMKKQVYPDGVDYEGSISYHRLVTELFLSATLLCKKNGISFPDWYLERLERMLEFIMHYTKPDGSSPQIGDNDDGRLHILADYTDWDRLDHRYLLSIGTVLFGRADFKKAAGEFAEEAFWLMGEDGIKGFSNLPGSSPPSSKAFESGGLYIMRHNDRYMIVDGTPANPKTPSGHWHCSRLSFELFAGGKSFIIDPGTYTYTADKGMRNLFRSTGYHNTVVVDDQEQNRFNQNELFNMNGDAVPSISQWQITPEYDRFVAEHSGYKRLKNPVVHQRQIYFDKQAGYWIIRDVMIGRGEHRFDLYLHLAPVEVELDKDFPLVIRTREKGTNLAIIPLNTDELSAEILDGWVSFRYGVKTEAPIVKYSKKCQAPATFCNIIYPYTGKLDAKIVLAKETKRIEHTSLTGEGT